MPKTLFLSPVMGKERVSHCAKGVPPGEAQAHAFHYKDQPFRYLTFTVLQLKKKKKNFYQQLDLSCSAELNVGHFMS